MLNQNQEPYQLSDEIKPVFQKLRVLKHLRNAGIRKRFGFSCSYLFQLVSVLLVHHKNWFLFESAKVELVPGKDEVAGSNPVVGSQKNPIHKRISVMGVICCLLFFGTWAIS